MKGQAPSGLTVQAATGKRVDLTWSGTAASYTVQRRPLGGAYTNVTTVSATTASDTQFDPYTTYQYQVVAGTSAPSNQVTVGPPPVGFTVAAPAPGAGGSTAADNYGYDISMVLDSNGDPALAFVYNDPNQDTDLTDTELDFRSWNRAKYAWNPVVRVATVGDIADYFHSTVSLAYDSSTNTFAVAAVNNQSAAVKVYVSTNGGLTWTPKANFQTADSGTYGPSLALTSGNVYLSYVTDADGLVYVTGKLSADSSTWQTIVAPQPADTDRAVISVAPSLALDSSGVPAIAYWVTQTSNESNQILLFWRPGGSPPVKVMDSEGNQSSNLAVKLLFFGQQPRVLGYVSRNDADPTVGVHFARSDDGGVTWATPVVTPPDGDATTDYPFDMALDSHDHGAIVFGQNGSSGNAVCGNPKLSLSTDLVNWKTCAAAGTDITGAFSPYPLSVAAVYGGNDKLYLVWKEPSDNPTGAGILMWREPPAAASTTPSITATNGVVSGATFQSGIVAGSWVTIFGANFTDVTETWANADFSSGNLPTSIGGVQVNINGQPTAVYYVSPTQINVQAPTSISGDVSVQVLHNGVVSNTVTATAVQNAPGLFTYAGGSKTYPASVFPNGVIVGDPAVVPSTRKVITGDRILLYATGLGPTAGGTVVPSAIAFPGQVTVKIGSANAKVEFAGLVAAGEFQINIVVPSLPDGDQPVTLTVNGKTSQPGVVIPMTH